ncbi:deoxynucleoside kinase [Mesoplasma chauliocola]|uniref:Deoxynucleoside kinase n=1 Tax=Mesoplasma chauliocola TaxID=216427 RepID=A0A249SNX0_9MOLU|nr:deoxynucleoside kinase [Mesoplasma chauliocola]ASZ09317.1 deoxynucleoside kinase [Mesoplasma chauliocola]
MRIAIFGTTGAGKTTICNELSKKTNYKLVLEPTDKNPYFDEFYKDIKQNGFKMQIFMLMLRTEQLYSTKNEDNIIFDRSIIEDPIFMKLKYENDLISELDYQTYLRFFKNVIFETVDNSKHRISFDLIVYLKVSSKVAFERIKKRGIQKEIDLGPDFWNKLNYLYEEKYQEYKNQLPFIVIDADNLDLNYKVDIILNEIEKGKIKWK